MIELTRLKRKLKENHNGKGTDETSDFADTEKK